MIGDVHHSYVTTFFPVYHYWVSKAMVCDALTAVPCLGNRVGSGFRIISYIVSSHNHVCSPLEQGLNIPSAPGSSASRLLDPLDVDIHIITPASFSSVGTLSGVVVVLILGAAAARELVAKAIRGWSCLYAFSLSPPTPM